MKKCNIIPLTVLIILLESTILNLLIAQIIDKGVYEKRRRELMNKMEGGMVIFQSAKVSQRNRDIEYEYRQNSDFYYLTGFEEPESAFMLIPSADKKFIMFIRGEDPLSEIWNGSRAGIETMMFHYAADTAFTIDRFEEILKDHLKGIDRVYCSFENEQLITKMLEMNKSIKEKPFQKLIDVNPILAKMRLIKSPEEITLLSKAIDITCEAQIEVMKAVEPGMFEYELEAIIDYIYRKNGSLRNGFSSIIGSGPNATFLHYDANNRQIREGDLVLMDIGAEYSYYSADVTRTFPANGKFSRKQRDVYEIVLEANKEAIEIIKPGIGFNEVQHCAVEVMTKGLYRLGLITNKDHSWQAHVWNLHLVNHWLGLDVHDVGGYNRQEVHGQILKPGMVFTVEPGIYISKITINNISKLLDEFHQRRLMIFLLR